MHEFYLLDTFSLSNAIDLIIVNFSLFGGIQFAIFFLYLCFVKFLKKYK